MPALNTRAVVLLVSPRSSREPGNGFIDNLVAKLANCNETAKSVTIFFRHFLSNAFSKSIITI